MKREKTYVGTDSLAMVVVCISLLFCLVSIRSLNENLGCYALLCTSLVVLVPTVVLLLRHSHKATSGSCWVVALIGAIGNVFSMLMIWYFGKGPLWLTVLVLAQLILIGFALASHRRRNAQ